MKIASGSNTGNEKKVIIEVDTNGLDYAYLIRIRGQVIARPMNDVSCNAYLQMFEKIFQAIRVDYEIKRYPK